MLTFTGVGHPFTTDNVVPFPTPADAQAPEVADWPTLDEIDEAESQALASFAIDEAHGDYARARRLLKRAGEIVSGAELERKADRILGRRAPAPPGAV